MENNKKYILIIGVNFYNVGAELMLKSVVKQAKIFLPENECIVSPIIGDRQKIKSLGLKTLNYPITHIGFGVWFRIFLKYGFLFKLFKKYRGDVNLSDVVAVFDLSGFAYGSQWGDDPILNLNLLMNYLSKHEVKYFMLPQALGPFKSNYSKSTMNNVLNKASLVFARDKISFQYISTIANNSNKEKIKLAPDLTLLYNEGKEILKINRIVYIPNYRMIDKGSDDWSKKYLSISINILKHIQFKYPDYLLEILLHDTSGDDKKVTDSIQKVLPDISIRVENNADVLKTYIATSCFVIGSRFHGLASALSSNVPAIAIGWSHKYEELFNDYELGDYVFLNPEESKIILSIDYILNENNYPLIIETIKKANLINIEKNKEMWVTIRNSIN